MNTKNLTLTLGLIFLVSISFASAIVVDADYVTIYPGESGSIELEIENNENFDMEDISLALDLGAKVIQNNGQIIGGTEALPFVVIGSSEKDVDDIDEDDDDSASFTLRASTDIEPGDYNIPYVLKYTNSETDEEELKTGSFGMRVSARTEIDFAVETRDNAIVGNDGKISLEIINKGLGEIKSVSVELFPEGFELLSKNKIFIGTIDAEDTDLASFDVIYSVSSPTLKAKVTYKDFDNEEHSETVTLPFNVYTQEEALEKGIIKKSNAGLYFIVIILIIIIWVVYRKIKKKRKKKNRG